MPPCHLLRSVHPNSHYRSFVRIHSSSKPILSRRVIQNHSSKISSDHSTQTLRSSNASTAITVAIAAGGVLVGSLLLTQEPNASEEAVLHGNSASIADGEYQQAMVGTTLPGRPGNLTPDQEAKLQELWTATFSVFGVSELDGADGAELPADQRSRAGTIGSEKKKKKRQLFNRKPKTAETLDGASKDSSDDLNDKHGQLKQFHHVLANMVPEDLRWAFWSMVKHDHPDELLLRFLRARKWDVHNALVMLIATMHWRLEGMHVDDDIVKRGEAGAVADSASSDKTIKKDSNDFMTQLRMGKSFVHGTDREGRPMCLVRVRLHKQGEQSEASLERYTVYFIETTRLMLAGGVDTAAIVFDMTGFSMANMDYGPVKFMIKCFEANYPESLGVVLVHKSPWIFHSIWNIIKGWLDPVVASKVHFTKNVEELETFIERSHIIKELGGDEPWEYKYIEPRAGENDLMSDDGTKQRLLDERAAVVKDFESATQQWVQDPQAGDSSKQKRNELAEQLRSGYWQLDPFIRARGLYDRTGLIKEGGKIQFYDSPDSVITPAPLTQIPVVTNGPLPAGHGADDVD